MRKTVICHFYNEEFLLPWWLKHHKQVFDYGIMINYGSTDNSVNLIKEICPDWEIVDSRNKYFISADIDREVEDYERSLSGWRMALNVTEFLYGNTAHLNDQLEPTQYFVGNYVFVDMGFDDALSSDIPLWKQRYYGFRDNVNNGSCHSCGSMRRMNRSIHNFSLDYPIMGGRHYANTNESFDDLFIFYYGWVDSSESGIQRKLQIYNKLTDWEKTIPNAHSLNRQQLLRSWEVDYRPISKDLREELSPILNFNLALTNQEF